MDFFQFLQKSTNNDGDKKQGNYNSKKTKRKTKTTPEEIQQQDKSEIQQELEKTHLYVQKGDIVKIVNVPNSILNNYKGYIGEIKDYKKHQDFALVCLQGTTSLSIIKFPLIHLIKYNDFS